MEVIIRQSVTDDLPEILEIMNHEIRVSTAVYEYDEKSIADIQLWFAEKQARNYPVFVAETENKVVGYASYGRFRPRIGYRFTVEHSVYIHPDAKGFGIGKKLMSTLIAEAKKQGYHVMLGAIDASNTGSIRFHERIGFKHSGTLKEVGYKFDKRLDVCFMQIFL